MGVKLKPCPFCGERAIVLDGTNRSVVGCTNLNCIAAVLPINTISMTKDKLIALWNRRAEVKDDA